MSPWFVLATIVVVTMLMPRVLDVLAHVSRYRKYRRSYPHSGLPFGDVWRHTA